jgi:RHS repeat-associated protein
VRVERTEIPSNGLGTSVHRFFLYTPELKLLAGTRDDGVNVWGGNPPTTLGKNIDYEIVWFGDRPVAQIAPGSTPLFTFADHLGTPILQTDSSRDVTWRVEYEPFGNVFEVRAGTRSDQPLRFPGQEVAMTFEGPEENDNIFRWYNSGWGRYTQPDPKRPAYPSTSRLASERPEVSSKIEPYSYAGGSPINSIDAFGLARCIFVPVTAMADYHDLGPLGPGTYKGCIMIGVCGGVNLQRISGGIKILFRYVAPGCPCPLWCTHEADDLTGKQISKTTCFNYPLPTMPPLM